MDRASRLGSEMARNVFSRKQPRILIIDDDVYFANYMSNLLADSCGYEVTICNCADEGLRLARQKKYSLIIVDLKMPPGKTLRSLDTSGGHKTGFVLARELRKWCPSTQVIIHSASCDADIEDPFWKATGTIFLPKSATSAQVIRIVKRLVDPGSIRQKSFIVHGHDKKSALELKNFLQNRLGFDEPTLLVEQPSRGLTIMEKFEANVSLVDWVFVLLTPDDIGGCVGNASEPVQGRARQNVIFELGYFYGSMRRQSGRVILLHKGDCSVPSDLNGIEYVDVTLGIETAGEQIRRALMLDSEVRGRC